MAAAVTDLLPLVVVLLPFASAVALALIASWRIGSWLNAGCASLLVVAACLLPWHLDASIPLLHVSVPETCLAMLTSLIAMTTGWFSHRELPALLAARSLDRRRVRLYHAAFQGLLGAILLALLSDNLVLTWLALAIAICAAAAVTGAVRTQAAGAAASHLLLLCGVGLMLALLGTLLLYVAANPTPPRCGGARCNPRRTMPQSSIWPASSWYSATARWLAQCRCKAGCCPPRPRASRQVPSSLARYCPARRCCCSSACAPRWVPILNCLQPFS